MEAEIESLLNWAREKGIELNGCAPKQLPGRGIGIVATQAIKPNQVILKVPTAALRSLANTPQSIITNLPGATVHALLSVALCLEDPSAAADMAPWRGVLPSKADVRAALPLCWPAELRALLPPAAAALLAKQSAKFQRDWAAVAPVYAAAAPAAPGAAAVISRDEFLYAWLLVNTRSFYHTTRRTVARRPREDHMVLQPVADLFNHSPQMPTCCRATFDDAAFAIAATAAHEPGEELFIRYGPHGNDFLLAEYGFTLPLDMNPWDETCLDPYMCPQLAAAGRRDRLEDAGFWGGYMLDGETPCYRTLVALRALCLTPLQWRAVLEGERDEDADKRRVDAELVVVLERYEVDIARRLEDVDAATAGEEASRRALRDRWMQILELVVETKQKLQQ